MSVQTEPLLSSRMLLLELLFFCGGCCILFFICFCLFNPNLTQHLQKENMYTLSPVAILAQKDTRKHGKIGGFLLDTVGEMRSPHSQHRVARH